MLSVSGTQITQSSAIAGSLEAASQPLLGELPGFETGTCVVGGTAIAMVTREWPALGVEFALPQSCGLCPTRGVEPCASMYPLLRLPLAS